MIVCIAYAKKQTPPRAPLRRDGQLAYVACAPGLSARAQHHCGGSTNEYRNSSTCTRTEGDYSTKFHQSRACACAQRTSAAARGEITLAGSWRLLAAAPVHFAHAVVTEIKIGRIINLNSHVLVKKLEVICILHNVKGGARQRRPQVLVHVARWDELQINKHTNTVMMQPLW